MWSLPSNGRSSPQSPFIEYSPRERRERSLSNFDVATEVSKEVWLLTRLTAQLLWALRVSSRWIIMTIRLFIFVALLFPAFIRIFFYWLLDVHVWKNIPYDPDGTRHGRRLLDVYTVWKHSDKLPKSSRNSMNDGKRKPVVVFFSGGAWIIGYKAWGAMMGKLMSRSGVVFVTPDYRNFPQGILPDMVEDANLAVQWVFNNIEFFGGDPNNVTLVGQSAGAHLAACMLIEHALAEGEDTVVTWRASRLRGFIGISGPYNIERSIEAFHRRGLDRSITTQIMNMNVNQYSPAARVLESNIHGKCHITECFPKVTLFHGTIDQTVSWKSSWEFANSLRSAGVSVTTKFYKGKSHTDPIIEDPIDGDDPLMQDILDVIAKGTPPDSPGPEKSVMELHKPRRILPRCVVQLARKVNPF